MSGIEKITDVNELLEIPGKVATALIAMLQNDGIDARIIETYRTAERQAWLFASGRTREGIIITNAEPGKSIHEFGCAWDIGIFIDGVYAPQAIDLWETAGKYGKALGCVWGGDWEMRDLGHFQLVGELSDEQIRAMSFEQLDWYLCGWYRGSAQYKTLDTATKN